jgi:hypothetical protein
MADIFTFQTLKITADGFSFGLRYTIYLLILLVIAVSFSAMAIAIPSSIRWFFAAFAVIAVIALPSYLKKVQQNNWKPEWGATRRGLIIGMESSLDVLTVAWEDVHFIKLMEHFAPKIGNIDIYRKVVLIGIRDDVPVNGFEKLVFRFQLPYGLPRNVILKSYSGASQDKVIDLLLGFMPFTLPFEKVDEPFTKGLRFQPKLVSEEGIEA